MRKQTCLFFFFLKRYPNKHVLPLHGNSSHILMVTKETIQTTANMPTIMRFPGQGKLKSSAE